MRHLQTNDRATSTNVILRKSRALARDCLEGWKRPRCLWSPFETPAFGRLLRVTVLFAARPSLRRPPPHFRQHLAAEDLDAGEDVVLRHAGPAHAHGKVGDAGAVLRDEFVRHLRRRADGEAP